MIDCWPRLIVGESMTKKSKSESILGKQIVSFKCVDAIEISLFIEKEGLSFYEKAAKHISDPRVKDMFTRLAEEEREHIQSLQAKVQFLQPVISGIWTTLYRNFIQPVGKRKETGCENYFFAFDGYEEKSIYRS